MADAKDLGLDFVGKVAGPLIAVWVFTLAIMALGVQKGVAGSSTFFMPLLVVMFVSHGGHCADSAGCGKRFGRFVYA